MHRITHVNNRMLNLRKALAILLVALFASSSVICRQVKTLFDVDVEELKNIINNRSTIFQVDSWRSCGSAHDSLNIKYFELTPENPVIGQTVRVHLVGYLSGAIQRGAKVDIRVQRFNRMVYHARYDVCAFLRAKQPINPSLPMCPVEGEGSNGLLDVMHSEYIPKAIPKASVTLSASLRLHVDMCISGYSMLVRNMFECSISTKKYPLKRTSSIMGSAVLCMRHARRFSDVLASKSAAQEEAATKRPENVGTPRVLLKFVTNNTFVAISSENGKLLTGFSTGALGFKNAQKVTPKSALTVADEVSNRLKALGAESIKLELRGFNVMRTLMMYEMRRAGIKFIEIYDTTGIPFNGCRPKKTRRL